MKNIFYFFTILTVVSCNHINKPASKNTEKKVRKFDAESIEKIRYSDLQLEAFLDSTGKLRTKLLADKEAFYADSIFKNQRQFDTLISTKDFNKLKFAIRKGAISVNTARRIFNNPQIDSSCTEKSIFLNYKPGLTPIEYYPFGKNKNTFDEYGICIGDPNHCPNACLYFLKGKRIIAMHNFNQRFAPGLYHYQDSDGKTVIYYSYMFAEGSNEWWFNYFFYKYDGNKLIPVLNELENGNVSMPVPRALWLESKVLKTNPLTIKMTYHDEFPDTSTVDFGPSIINDSTTIKYIWDKNSKTLKGQYEKAKINESQILSYYLPGNNLLFINSHYRTLKEALQNKTKRKSVLDYLQKIKSGSN
ncbi:hypothetical protein [Mucilaginibacter sp. FT3.2]|uniref:hypothetical protein n=1 Tax=Mucilaginibacter sp. FT3.2 TaxID=2723090 RepID=UPI0016089ABF|nr:hypothetical protein [Mucilaginibacter sp. FT3.2]MBB6230228.1 hypothetical protein [Mucilaginibacter sp. FT3.2]